MATTKKLGFAALALSSFVFGAACKRGEETVAATDAAAPPTTPVAETPDAAAAPPAEPVPVTPTPVSTTTKPAIKDGGTDAAAPAPDGGKPDAGGGSTGGGNKLQACLQTCGAKLQACLTPTSTDGGIPRIDPAGCNKVAEQCRTACTP
jgi:hypothetical protein